VLDTHEQVAAVQLNKLAWAKAPTIKIVTRKSLRLMVNYNKILYTVNFYRKLHKPISCNEIDVRKYLDSIMMRIKK